MVETASASGKEGLQEALDFLVTEEQLGVTFVTAAIENAPGTPSEQFLPVLRNAVTQEYNHVEALKDAGGKPLTTHYWFPDAAFDGGSIGLFTRRTSGLTRGYAGCSVARMATEEAESLYERLGGVYSIAVVVDDFIDRIMVDPRLNANPRVDEAHHRVSAQGFKYYVTEQVCWAAGGPQSYSGRSMVTRTASCLSPARSGRRS